MPNVAVIDVETTGLNPYGHDRVVEIAAVVIEPDGTVVREFCSLINPERDIGPTSIHGLSANDVTSAPRFSEIAGALLEVAERLADGRLPKEHLPEILEIGELNANGYAVKGHEIRRLGELLDADPGHWNRETTSDPIELGRFGRLTFQPLFELVPAPVNVHLSLHSADIIREVFPNPFRACWWREEWRSTDAVSIAKKMYDSNSFHAMGELADTLEEAGCQDCDILLHCREEYAVHYRGCWVIDWILDQNCATLNYLGLQ